jgi:hypothetical protein
MCQSTIFSEVGRGAEVALPEPFDGYPYLVTRIGHSALRHMAVLPADWPRRRLLDLARRQAEANRLETCLCLGPSEAVSITTGGKAVVSMIIPTGIPVVERLALAEPVPQTEEVAVRRIHLHAYAERLNTGGYLVGDGLEGGRPATREEIHRLSPPLADGIPGGLTRCPTCRWLAGDYLALHGEGDGDLTPRVIRVHCRCENHNRCAGCGETLADWRLSAYHYDETNRRVWYIAAYSAFSHRCPRGRKTAQDVVRPVDRRRDR